MVQESGKYSIWLRFSLFNLVLVALFGALMRYKIGFEFPFFQQKYLLHAHSHFAFAGWISHTLMTLMAMFISGENTAIVVRRYRTIIISNLICAFGMLITFTLQGYALISIIFSTSSIVVSWFFIYYYLIDLKKYKSGHPSVPWFRAALFFHFISSAGTFYLAYMMKSGTFDMDLYLGSVYYYLHFQYNGWFFFACMGLFIALVRQLKPDFQLNRNVFLLFAISCIPAYLLSILWLKFPDWLFIIITGAALAQLAGWICFTREMRKSVPLLKTGTDTLSKYFLLFVFLCVTVKLILQLFSTIPAVSKLAFGFRPIVIAYLHLVLLAIISIFLLTYLHITGRILSNRILKFGLITFLAGVFLNELLLLIQGIGSFTYMVMPGVNEMLFWVAIVLLFGAISMFLSQFSKKTAGI